MFVYVLMTCDGLSKQKFMLMHAQFLSNFPDEVSSFAMTDTGQLNHQIRLFLGGFFVHRKHNQDTKPLGHRGLK